MKTWTAFTLTAAVAAAHLIAANPAKADPPQASAAAPAQATTQTLTLDTSKLRGLFAGVELGAGTFGYQLTANLGAQAQELHILGDKKYVLQWNGDAQLLAGLLANTHPFNVAYGTRASIGGEAGIRLIPSLKVSPYIALAASGDGHSIAVAGDRSLSQLNNTDGFAGTAGAARARLNIGASVLGKSHLEAVAFIQEEILSKETDAPSRSFTDIGLHLKYDAKNSFTINGDLWIGMAGQNNDPALGTTTQTTRWGVALNTVKTLGEHWLIGGGVALGREGNTTSTAGSALVFTTAEPLTATFNLQVGYGL